MLAACSPGLPAAGRGEPLPSTAQPQTPPTGWRMVAAPSAGVLTYDVAIAATTGRVVAIELDVAFELVVREPDGAQVARVHLGPPDYDMNDVALTPDGSIAYVASADGRVLAIDVRAATLTGAWHVGAPASAVAVSATGELVATATTEGVVCLRRRRDGALLQCVIAHRAPIGALAFTPRARAPAMLASAAHDGTVAVWRVPSLQLVSRHTDRGSANGLAFDSRGRRLAVARSAAPPNRSPAIEAREQRDARPAAPLAVIHIIEDGAVTRVLRGHDGPVTGVAWTGGDCCVVSSSWDRSIRLWRVDEEVEIAQLGGFTHLIHAIAADARGALVAVAAWAVAPDSPSTALVQLLYSDR